MSKRKLSINSGESWHLRWPYKMMPEANKLPPIFERNDLMTFACLRTPNGGLLGAFTRGEDADQVSGGFGVGNVHPTTKHMATK